MQDNIIELAAVDGARWLLFFRSETEAVEIDIIIRNHRVTLVRLRETEVTGAACMESVIAVQANQRRTERVLAHDTGLSAIVFESI